MTFVDTNVLVDIITNGDWADWSQRQLDAAWHSGAIRVNDIVFAELSVRFGTIAEVENFLSRASIEIAPIPRAALFVAGKVFVQYRRAGGLRTGVLPDFFIGAHAAVMGLPLLTRDARRYRKYFPTLDLIAPD